MVDETLNIGTFMAGPRPLAPVSRQRLRMVKAGVNAGSKKPVTQRRTALVFVLISTYGPPRSGLTL